VTLAGLLAFGQYPRQFFPQLLVSVVVRGGQDPAARFLDNATLRGSVPQMIADTPAVVERHLSVAAVMTDRCRGDRADSPAASVRQAVASALLHRSRGPITRGTRSKSRPPRTSSGRRRRRHHTRWVPLATPTFGSSGLSAAGTPSGAGGTRRSPVSRRPRPGPTCASRSGSPEGRRSAPG